MNAETLKKLLHLAPLPMEGGCYFESYRAPESVAQEALPARYSGARCFGTAIYYLLEPDTFSTMHRVRSDEIFHFYLGDTVEMLQLWPDGTGKVVRIGTDLANGARPQVVVPHGVWQGARLAAGGTLALLGCTVSPGFEFADYEGGARGALSKAYPAFAEMIAALTPAG